MTPSPDPASTGRLPRALSIAAMLIAIGAVVVVTRAMPPIPGRTDSVAVEWPFGPGDRVLLGVVVTVLSVGVLISGRIDMLRRRAAVSGWTVAGAVLAISWAALPVAIWADLRVLRGLGFIVGALLPVAMAQLGMQSAHLASAGPPLLRSRWPWTSAYLVLGVLAVCHVLARDPFLDPRCVVHCESFAPPLPSPSLLDAVDLAMRVGGAVIAVAAALLALVALRRSRPSLAWLALLPTAAAGAVEVAWSFVPTAAAVVGPFPLESPRVLTARLAAHTALAVGSIVVLLRRLHRQGLLCRMAREIVAVTPPNSVRDILVARLGDPQAQVAFFVPSAAAWIDEQGRPLEAATSSQTATISRDGGPVARVDFTAAGTDARDLEDALGPATTLALEAERARAEVLMRLRELRISRRRVVEESDAARRRAERDLHDGAQHLLLAATFAIQEGLEHARNGADRAATARLEKALAEVTGVAADLRTLAHGMYPVLLGDAGLVPALEGLALSSAVATTVDASFHERTHPSVELTVYRVGALAVGAANGSPVGMELREQDGRLRLRVSGADLPVAERRSLADRASALGGTLVTTPGSTLLEVPCA